MGKASKTKVESSRREKIAAQQAAARRAEQRRRLYYASGSIIVVLVIVVVFVVVKLNGGKGGTDTTSNGPTGAALTSLINTTTSVPASTLDAVGNGGGAVSLSRPQTISGTPLTLNGKPEVLYMGAEYCPYCAAERWAMVVAFSRFGTFTGLGTVHSAAKDGAGLSEPYPDTPTWTFANATFSSQYVAFQTVEQYTNIPDAANKGYTALQTPTSAELALLEKYDAPPLVSAGQNGAIPFMDFGNKYGIGGASYNPGILAGLTWAQIAADLSNPNSTVAKAIDGTANYLTAAICGITNNLPATACTSTIQALNGTI